MAIAGIQYVIDRFFQNCTISPIHGGSYDSEVNMQQKVKDGSYIIQMKNPLDFFHITKDVRFIGQVREYQYVIFQSWIKNEFRP